MKYPKASKLAMGILTLGLFIFTASFAAYFYLTHFNPAALESYTTLRDLMTKPAPAVPEKSVFYTDIGSLASKGAVNKDANDPGSEHKEQYTLELFVASSRDEAESTVAKFKKLGIESYYTPLQREDGVVYRVRRGIFPSMDSANHAANELKLNAKIAVEAVRL